MISVDASYNLSPRCACSHDVDVNFCCCLFFRCCRCCSMHFSPCCACSGRASQPSLGCCFFCLLFSLFVCFVFFSHDVFTSLCLQWSCSPTITCLLFIVWQCLFVCFIFLMMFSPHCVCSDRALQPSHGTWHRPSPSAGCSRHTSSGLPSPHSAEDIIICTLDLDFFFQL